MPASNSVDLTNCDREPIHIPGSVQQHGCLLAADVNAAVILRHSANAGAMLNLEGDLNGRTLEGLVGGEATHTLRNALATSTDPSKPSLLIGLKINGKAFDVSIHSFKSTTIIEFEESPLHVGHPMDLSRVLLARIKAIDDSDRLIKESARLIRAVLGYDRVMIYRFVHDGAGQVVSEAKRSDLESFLGQYFPASDIPQQARALYLRNTIRIISNADGENVPLVPVIDASGEPLDLSYAHLRSVSPIHCEYLRNMGVGASMSISIIVGGELWGLIACHHYSPRTLSMAQRTASEMFGEFFSLHLEVLRQKTKLNSAAAARRSLDRVLQRASSYTDIGEVLRSSITEYANLMECDGVGLWMEGIWSEHGVTMSADEASALAHFVGQVADGKIWATHALSQRMPEAFSYAHDVSGVLAIPLSQRPRDYLFFFRKEVVQTLNWAGNPEKSYETGPHGDRLTPRKSFAIWKEAVQQQAQPWTDADREIAEAARSALVEVLLRQSEIIADERAKADVRQRMLNEELNHRVKNILAIIKSLVGHPVQDGRDLSEYVASLKGRIQALALAHDQIVRGDGGGLLSELLAAELSPYRTAASKVTIEGPPAWLDSRAFSVMALVLHELSTNAAKYGALSVAGGEVNVSWTFSERGDCTLNWLETGGPAVSPPKREGFGTILIRRSLPYDLGGESDVDYAPSGFSARFVLPARHVSRVVKQKTQAAVTSPDKTSGTDNNILAGQKLLVVEDQMLIALDVESMLAAKGATDITTCASADDALRQLQTFKPDAAILDINLGMGTSVAVAEELAKLDIPFVFATGYGDTAKIPKKLARVPVVRKPYESRDLIDAITRVLKI